MEKKSAVLYGVGVGPGDPGLITIKAINVIKQVDVIFAVTHKKTKKSLSLEIVKQYLKSHTPVKHVYFAMDKDKKICRQLYEENGRLIAQELKSNQTGAFITLGDPMFYSTYIYIMKYLQTHNPEIIIKTIPGISSINAASALVNIPLAEGEESITIMSGTNGISQLKNLVREKQNLIILKTYKKFKMIYQELKNSDLLNKAFYVSRCGLTGEYYVENMASINNLESFHPHYLSMIIVKWMNGENDKTRLQT